MLNHNAVIYKLSFIGSEKFYVGSTMDFQIRKCSHINDLYKNKHHSPILIKAANKYGLENICFTILEEYDKNTITRSKLIEREQYYLDLLKPYEKEIGYNTCHIADSPQKIKHTEETKRKISLAHKGRIYGPTGKPAWNKGRKLTNKEKEKISLSLLGKKRSEESIEKTAYPYSLVDKEGNIFIGTNIQKFAKSKCMDSSCLSKVVRGERISHKGYKIYKK